MSTSRPQYPYRGMNNEEIDVALAMWRERTSLATAPPGTCRVVLPGGTFPPAEGGRHGD